jgi:hypothetical protein
MRAVPLAFAVLSALAVVPARADIGEGNWEMEITTVVPGAPVAPVKQTQCMTAADARDPANLIGSAGPGCSFNNRRDDGSTFSFDIVCAAGAALSGNGRLRYAHDSLDGEIAVRMKQGDQTVEMRSLIKARRIGPCR